MLRLWWLFRLPAEHVGRPMGWCTTNYGGTLSVTSCREALSSPTTILLSAIVFLFTIIHALHVKSENYSRTACGPPN